MKVKIEKEKINYTLLIMTILFIFEMILYIILISTKFNDFLEVIVILIFGFSSILFFVHIDFFEKVYILLGFYVALFFFVSAFIRFNYLFEELFIISIFFILVTNIYIIYNFSYFWKKYIKPPMPIYTLFNHLVNTFYSYNKWYKIFPYFFIGLILAYLRNFFFEKIDILSMILLLYSKTYFLISLLIFLVLKISGVYIVNKVHIIEDSSLLNGLLLGIIFGVWIEILFIRSKIKTRMKIRKYIYTFILMLVMLLIIIFFQLQFFYVFLILGIGIMIMFLISRIHNEIIVSEMSAVSLSNHYTKIIYDIFYTIYTKYKIFDYSLIGFYLRNFWYIINIYSLSNIGGGITIASDEDSANKIHTNIKTLILMSILSLFLGYILSSVTNKTITNIRYFSRMNFSLSEINIFWLTLGIMIVLLLLPFHLKYSFINIYSIPLIIDLPYYYLFIFIGSLLIKYLIMRYRKRYMFNELFIYVLYGYITFEAILNLIFNK